MQFSLSPFRFLFFSFIYLSSINLFSNTALSVAQAGTVKINKNQLWIDGEPQPQLYGAELQYFRLRGGAGRNIPRQEVITLWNQALDRMVEAKMNAISFYIPWDFHEYAEGKFDFTGTADEDGDGRADYPSRDIFTFFRLIQEHGIKHIMARPGPYINAEWGFLGFGAIPLWFHEKYPNSHARNSKGQKTTLYSYNDPDFLRHSQIWLETVYHEVLSQYIGPGRPISFIQVDNETNLMWQSVYNHDYNARNISQYQKFLKKKYLTLTNLNSLHGRNWQSWSEILPPAQPVASSPTHLAKNITEDQDWYTFQDHTLYIYLKKIRKIWESLGLKEPKVLFTLAESYNATENGLLPHYKWRNSHDTGMMTVNLYPKVYETDDKTLMNQPFKADHDVKAADAASDFYLGRREEWVLGPEIQGGWWKGIHVSEESRRQTYLTTIGHGLKALFIYYFNEGNNWQYDWLKKAITPFYEKLKNKDIYKETADKDLPAEFWAELDDLVADKFLVVRTRSVWLDGSTHPETLYFDAPLGPDAKPREPYQLVKSIGEKLVAPYGDFLGKAEALEDAVCIIKDSNAHAPSTVPGVNSRLVQSDWNAGLLALLMHAGVNARIHHWKLNPKSDLLDQKLCKLIIYQDTGFASAELTETLLQAIDRGSAVLSFIHTGLADSIKAHRPQSKCTPLPTAPMDAIGQRCSIGTGLLYHAKVPIYDVFNTDFYYKIHDANERRGFIENILGEVKIIPHVKIKGGGDRTVAFARTNHDRSEIWITVKTSKRDGFKGQIQWTKADHNLLYTMTNVLEEKTVEISGLQLASNGFQIELANSDSEVFYIKPKSKFMPKPDAVSNFNNWLKLQEQISLKRMLQNISPEGAAPGTVIASPSHQSPNYRFHWVRDASLVMDVVINRQNQNRLDIMRDFITLSRRQQLEPSAEGLGEPRFLVDGAVDTIQWARPQYDGPALRALTLLRFINGLSKKKASTKERISTDEAELKLMALEVIRTDINFVLTHWDKPCYDLWEELRALHFYTQTVQYSSLLLASEYFKTETDSQFINSTDQDFLKIINQEILKIEPQLEKYWDPKKRYIVASLNREPSPLLTPVYKDENLDTAVILAALHGNLSSNLNHGHIFFLAEDRLLATAYALEMAFSKEYSINNGRIAIGRFTDDIYFGGNPWYMTTAAFAEFYFRLAQTLKNAGEIAVTKNNVQFFRSALGKNKPSDLRPGKKISTVSPLGKTLLTALRRKGDTFLEVIQKYVGDQGQMSEQFDRDAGVPVSAYDLTWSYAGFLSALNSREN